MKTIWFGSKDDNVRFAESDTALKSHGIENPQSFTVDGEVNGLTLVGDTDQQQLSGGAQQATG